MATAHCSPATKKGGGKEFTCFSEKSLLELARLWNEAHADRRASLINLSGGLRSVWEQMRERMRGTCSNEVCWLSQDFAQSLPKEIKDYTFMPTEPVGKGKEKWLSTSDLEKVMDHYEHAYPFFEFIGALAIDFGRDVLELDIASMYRSGKTIIGFIFNMDPAHKSGSHWVSMCVNMRVSPPYIGYFDSYGQCPPPKEIVSLVRNLQRYQIKGHKFVYKCNPVRHQYAGSECGVYSIYFLVETIKGRSFEDITRKIVNDEEIKKRRSLEYFSPPVA